MTGGGTSDDRCYETTGQWTRTKRGIVGRGCYFIPNPVTWLNGCEACGILGRKSRIKAWWNAEPSTVYATRAEVWEDRVTLWPLPILCMGCANKRRAISERISDYRESRYLIRIIKQGDKARGVKPDKNDRTAS